MTYKHTEDIAGDGSIEWSELNDLARTAVHRIVNSFESLTHSNNKFKELIALQLEAFLHTQSSIIALLKLKDTNILMSADAMSLVREQVEKVFVVALLCDDPDKWVDVYAKDEFQRVYKHHLLVQQERECLPRHQDFYQNIAPPMFDGFMTWAKITPLEKEWIEFKFYNKGKTLPAHLSGAKVEPFPTPGAVITKITDPSKKEFLERWHREYEYICGYSHAGLMKLQLAGMTTRRAPQYDPVKREIYYEKEIYGLSLWTGYVAAASACVETLKFLPYDINVLGALEKWWMALRKMSLLAKAIWDLGARDMFPKSIGG
jgi:hypothetical protein